MSYEDENAAWTDLVCAAQRWASKHMDQWDKFKFDTRYGVVYVRIARDDEYPDDYVEIPYVIR